MPLGAYQYSSVVELDFIWFWTIKGTISRSILGTISRSISGTISWSILCYLRHKSIFQRLNLILFDFWTTFGTISRSMFGTISRSILGTISWSILGTILCHLGHTSIFLRLNLILFDFWSIICFLSFLQSFQSLTTVFNKFLKL